MRNIPKLFLLFSHELTDAQIQEAKRRFQIHDFVPLPIDLQKQWSQIPPAGELPMGMVRQFIDYLEVESKEGDYLLIHGELGMVLKIVEWAKNNDRISIFSTTRRIIIEKRINDETCNISHIFQHVQFRLY